MYNSGLYFFFLHDIDDVELSHKDMRQEGTLKTSDTYAHEKHPHRYDILVNV